jgi:hypothetical protein
MTGPDDFTSKPAPHPSPHPTSNRHGRRNGNPTTPLFLTTYSLVVNNNTRTLHQRDGTPHSPTWPAGLPASGASRPFVRHPNRPNEPYGKKGDLCQFTGSCDSQPSPPALLNGRPGPVPPATLSFCCGMDDNTACTARYGTVGTVRREVGSASSSCSGRHGIFLVRVVVGEGSTCVSGANRRLAPS